MSGLRLGIDARMVRITGIGRYTEELVTGLTHHGVTPTVFVSPVDAAWWHLRHPEIPYRISSEPIYSWSEQLILPARLAREQFDVVHFTNFNVPLAYRGPFVVTIHDTIPLHYSGERRRSGLSRQAYQRVLRSALERAQRIIVPSIAVRDELAELGDISRVAVVPHGISSQFVGPASSAAVSASVFRRLGIDRAYLLYVGNDRSHKNLDALLQGVALLKQSIPQVLLVLAGPQSAARHRALRSQITQLGLGEAVRFCKDINDETLRVLYDNARLVVAPGTIEGFCLPALEAAARGTPVVASQSIPVREFLHDAVLSFDPNKYEQLANTVAVAWVNDRLRSRLGQRARAYALRRDWDMVAADTLALYQQAHVGGQA